MPPLGGGPDGTGPLGRLVGGPRGMLSIDWLKATGRPRGGSPSGGALRGGPIGGPKGGEGPPEANTRGWLPTLPGVGGGPRAI